MLFSSAGVGTIVGALFLASLGNNPKRGSIYLTGIFVWVVALTGFAVSGQFWISMTALLVFGIGQTLAGTTTITLLQIRVPEQMRGRVMSLNTLLIMGIRPLGDFPAGALIAGNRSTGNRLVECHLGGNLRTNAGDAPGNTFSLARARHRSALSAQFASL